MKKPPVIFSEEIWDKGVVPNPEESTGPKMLLDTVGKFKYLIYNPHDKETQLLQEQTMRPVDIIKEQLQKKLLSPDDNRTYFLKAGTGAGKSTFFLNELMPMLGAKDMICTKPRVKLVLDPMEELPLYFPNTFVAGQNLGFKIGGRSMVPTAHPSLTFCTTQILANMLQFSPEKVFEYRFCVVDEVHDMSEQMLSLLYQIKGFLTEYRHNKECPVFIFMSATLNIEKFKRYFYVREYNPNDIGFLIPSGMKYSVEYKYFGKDDMLSDRLRACLQYLDSYYKENDIPSHEFKDILIFTKGNPTLRSVVEQCQQFKFSFPVKVFPYTAKDIADQSENYKLFNAEIKEVKIIVSTTLLEAGANIPGLFCVIDTAIQQKPIFNSITQRVQIQSISCSKSTIEQRKGRVGRNAEGIYCGLYPEDIKLEEDDPNPMLISKQIFMLIFQFLKYLLRKYDMQKLDLQLLDLIEPLSSDVILAAYHKLIMLNLIQQDGTITPFFKTMVQEGFTSFVKFLGVVHKCKAFDAAFICALQSYELMGRPGTTTEEIIQNCLNNNFRDLSIGNLLDTLGATYDILAEWGDYPVLKSYDKDGAVKLYQTLNAF